VVRSITNEALDPLIGTFISGALCTVFALTQDWLTIVLVLAYFIGVHTYEGDVVGQRLVGKAVGIHLIVSLLTPSHT
jgi:predicted PurR-regulated permease PerM